MLSKLTAHPYAAVSRRDYLLVIGAVLAYLYAPGMLLIDHWDGAILLVLLIAGIVLAFQSKAKQQSISPALNFVIVVFAVYALIALFSWLGADVNQMGEKKIGRYLRFLLLGPLLLVLLRIKLRSELVFLSLSVGAILSGINALLESLVLPDVMTRATGETNAILYGDLSLAMGFMAAAGLLLFKRFGRFWMVVPLLALLMGILASFLSGSRGGWLAIPPLILLLPFAWMSQHLSVKKLSLTVAAMAVLVGVLVVIPQTGIQQRVQVTLENISSYSHGKLDTSVGQRLQMWRAAWGMFVENPLTGAGVGNYRRGAQELFARGEMTPVAANHNHPHSEYLSVLATRGLIGGVGLLLIFGVPLLLFFRTWREGEQEARAVAVAGGVLVIGYMVFGLTEAIFDRVQPISFYIFLTAIWLAQLNRDLDRNGGQVKL